MDVQTFTAAEGMDSREIARITGKRHDHVVRDIEEQLGAPGVVPGGFHQFERQYQGDSPDLGNGSTMRAPGRFYRCYVLPKRECLILATSYRADLRAKIIDRWMELEAKIIIQTVPTKPLSRMEILRMALEAEEKVQALEAQCAMDAPKVAAQELLSGAGGLFGIREAGKQVNMGQKEFISFLENSRPKIMYRVAGGGLTPYQIWIDRGYFAITTGTAVHGEDAHAWRQPKFTAKGIAWIAEKVGMQQKDLA